MGNSPIERMLRDAICSRAEVEHVDIIDYCDERQDPMPMGSGRVKFSLAEWADGTPDCYEFSRSDDLSCWYLFSQIRVAGYVVDMILVNSDGGVAIECDGFEFHDRTKQQAAYDRSRDRALLALGLATIRFTGSEIHHDADRCAAEAFACARSEAKRNAALMLGYDLGHDSGRKEGILEGARECYARIGRAQTSAPEEHW